MKKECDNCGGEMILQGREMTKLLMGASGMPGGAEKNITECYWCISCGKVQAVGTFTMRAKGMMGLVVDAK